MTESWKGRVLREAQGRAAEIEGALEDLAAQAEPLQEELDEVRGVISALEGDWQAAVRGTPSPEPAGAPTGAAEKPEKERTGGRTQKKRSKARKGARGSMREPIPPELAEMPGMIGRKHVSTSMIAGARKELSVWERVPHDRAFIASEIGVPDGLTAAKVPEYLKRFFRAGLLLRTGNNRRPEGVDRGRVSYEYRVPQEYEPTPEEVRDLITHSWLKSGEAFTVAQVMETSGGVWAEGPTRAALGTLAQRGTLRGATSPEGAYVYVKPEGGNPAGGNGKKTPQPVSHPVAGTGGGKRSSNKEVRELMDAVEKQGATVSLGGKHPVVHYQGQRVKLASTPSDNRTLANTRADLRRIGLDV